MGNEALHQTLREAFPPPTDIDWMMILPMVIVALTGLLALILEVARPKRDNGPLVLTSLIGLGLSGAAIIYQYNAPAGTAFAGAVLRDSVSLTIQLILIAACGLTVLFSDGYLREKRIAFGEFYPLVTWATVGGMMMATSTNLLVLFVGLEMLSIALYVLAGMSRSEQKSEESALKYFLLGAFASAFFLYGIALFFGTTGSLDLISFNAAFASGDPAAKTMAVAACCLLFIGLGFKSGFVPFHQWTPDVYQGAPTNVTAFMAVGSKVAAIAALYRLFQEIRPLSDVLVPSLAIIAGATMIVGNVVAILQKDIKRVLGYSSIAHAGYLLTALLANYVAPKTAGPGAFLYYLVSYSLMTLGVFAVVTLIARDGKETTKIDDLRGLWHRAPAAAIALVIFMCSLIGIPPTAGFFGKFLIFQDALSSGLTTLAIILAASSVVSVYYYLMIALKAFVEDDTVERPAMRISMPVRITVGICIAGIILAGIFTSPLTRWLTGEGKEPTTAVALAKNDETRN